MTPGLAGRTPSPTRLDALTGLRAVLAVWVALYHFVRLDASGPPADWAGPFLGHGYLAVDGFFLLSGFVIAHGWGDRLRHADVATWWSFLRARLARLYPLHLVTLLGMGALVLGGSLASGIPIREPDRFSAEAAVSNLLLLHAGPWTDRLTWNYPSWSIAAEFAAYAAAPLALRLVLAGKGRGTALALLPLLFGALVALWHHHGTLNLYLHGWPLVRIGIEFTLGAALRSSLRHGTPLPGGTWLGWIAASLVLVFARSASEPAVVASLILLLAALSDPRDRLGALLARPLMVRLGEASFALYMVHALVEAGLIGIHRLGFPTARLPPWAQATLGIALSQALAFPLHAWIERPGRALLLGRPARRVAPALGPAA